MDNYSTFHNLILQSKKNSLSNVGVNIASRTPMVGGGDVHATTTKGYKYNSNIARIRKQLVSSGRQIQSAHPPLYGGWLQTPKEQLANFQSRKSVGMGKEAKLPS